VNGRLPCCVPFCRRTTKAGRFSEWICGKHWPLVPPELRRLKRGTERAYAAANLQCEAIDLEAYECAKANGGGVHINIIERFGKAAHRRDRKRRQAARVWERCKRAAVARTAGIGGTI